MYRTTAPSLLAALHSAAASLHESVPQPPLAANPSAAPDSGMPPLLSSLEQATSTPSTTARFLFLHLSCSSLGKRMAAQAAAAAATSQSLQPLQVTNGHLLISLACITITIQLPFV
jgi:hypothetical protein